MALGGSVAMMRINAKATPINGNDNNFHIMTMELVWPIVWGSYRATLCCWLLMASGAGVHARTHTHAGVRAGAIWGTRCVHACVPGLVRCYTGTF